MSDEKWVTLTPEQVEVLEQGVIVRAHRGDTTVQGPLEGLVGEYGPDVWVGEFRVKSPDWIAVRERDVPESDLDPVLRPGDRVRLVDFDGREFHCTVRPAASQDSAVAAPQSDAQPAGVPVEGLGAAEAVSGPPGVPVVEPATLKAGDRVSYLMRSRPYAGRIVRDDQGPLFIDIDNGYSLASHGRWLDGVSDVRLLEAAPEPDPQRLVSVRADDLEALFAFYEPRWSHARPQSVARVNAALRGETS